MSVKIIVSLPAEDIYKLERIGFEGLASDGHRQDFDFCLRKAITDFIKKYPIESNENNPK